MGARTARPRDAEANNLAAVLDLGGPPDLDTPHWTMPAFEPENCAAQWVEGLWDGVLSSARDQGFPGLIPHAHPPGFLEPRSVVSDF